MHSRTHSPLALVILALAAWALFYLTGCASTTVYKDGEPVFFTQSNARVVDFRNGDVSLHIEGLNHSTPTRAGGSVIGTATAGALPIITAITSNGLGLRR